jgi:tetratricopeptide (TPR) repeat protein
MRISIQKVPKMKSYRIVAAISCAVVFLFNGREAPSQASGPSVDLDSYYRFPLSIGFEYQSLTPLTSLNMPYSIFDAAGTVTMPLPAMPVLQPFVRLGYTRFNSLDTQIPGKWDNYHLYGSLGLAYSKKIAKNFEIGADIGAGASEAVFPNLVPDEGAVGTPYLLLAAGGKVSLTPSYGFSLDLHPGLRYQKAMGPFNELDGVLMSIGVSASFRLGEDPDSARAIIRSLRFDNARIPPVFSAMQSYYASNPIGTVSILNTEKQAVTDVEVSFNQKEYMDSPTPSFSIARIEAGKGLPDVPLKAVFNSKVYELEGGMGYTPLTGEVVVTYKLGGRSAEQRYPVTYNLYDKRAMTWDDDRKAAAFITPLDRALKNYSAFVNEACRRAVLPAWNPRLQVAAQLYDALRELGISYQEDPAAPFSKVQADRGFVDFISMPRDTLARKYGDCKNLTVLFCSLLETKSVPTGFITVPGHIFPAFDSGQPAAGYADINPDRNMTLAIDGTLWVPIEVTMLDGKSDFLAAWQRAIEEWKANESSRAFYRTREAQAVFSPVAVQQTDLGLQYGSAEEMAKLFSRDLDSATKLVLDAYAAKAERSKDKRDLNRLGIASAKFNRLKGAEDAFTQALAIDAKYVGARVNLGNVYYLRGDFPHAVDSYKSALSALGKPDPSSASSRTAVSILVNTSKAYAAMKRSPEAKAALEAAAVLDPEQATRFALAPVAGSDGLRAASQTDDETVGYIEE